MGKKTGTNGRQKLSKIHRPFQELNTKNWNSRFIPALSVQKSTLKPG